MTMLQIRNVPDDVHRRLKARAALAGMSLSEYALRELQHAAERPTRAELIERLRAPSSRRVAPTPTAMVRAERDARAVVVDASAVLELLLATPAGAAVAQRIGDESLHAPELLGVEVVSVLNRMTTTGRLTSAEALDLLAVLAALDVQTYPHDVLLARIHQLRDNLTAYDAAYIALAEATAVTLITCDAKLARAPGHRARCELIG